MIMAKKKKQLSDAEKSKMVKALGDRWRDNGDGTWTNMVSFEYKDPATKQHNTVVGQDMNPIQQAFGKEITAVPPAGVTRNLEEAFALEINRPAEEPVTEEFE